MIQRLGGSGCNDALVLTHPELITQIHREYIESGADIIETDTFNANALSLAEYGLSDRVYEINFAAAKLARQAAGDDRYVAGSMGSTNVSLSISDTVRFDEMEAAYYEQVRGLIDGGVDVLLIETVFDSLNAKAAISACQRAMGDNDIPLIISATLNNNGRLLTGQSLEAFVISVSHARPLSIGLNCGFGIEQLLPYIERLQSIGFYISIHANAGLPDELGRYSQTPEHMTFTLRRLLERGMVNIVGGCCGTTPDHIRAISASVSQAVPRKPAAVKNLFQLSANEAFVSDKFFKVGERCNVAGSRNFLKLIQNGDTEEAVAVAARQVADGASVLDINMDDAMLDATKEMTEFVRQLSLDPITSKVPLMIDSSNFPLIELTLKLLPGRSIVNSISLKEGEVKFIEQARKILRLGAAVMVMAFDEQGQADTFDRRIEICQRAYRILTEQVGFRGEEIVFDPNVLAVATGIEAHANYAIDFIRATEWIVENLPGARVSGGISNLSFAFRGKNDIRKAMHALFLEHARAAGLGMAIVNPSAPISRTPEMPLQMLEAIDDVLLNRRADATERLVEVADSITYSKSKNKEAVEIKQTGVNLNEKEVLALVETKLSDGMSPMEIINGPLMNAINLVGEMFGRGELFLPQVVKAAGVMQKAVDRLTPLISNEATVQTSSRPKFVLATVKGDVHDIGKNIVATVLRCSGFEVLDLGVMVPTEDIIRAAINHNADMIGLSGLITPSLEQMCDVARQMEKQGLKIPLFVGGATTSDMHTAVKIAPLYSGVVVRTSDAASLPRIALNINILEPEIKAKQEALREKFVNDVGRLSIEEAAKRNIAVIEPAPTPKHIGAFDFHPTIAELSPLINWRAFLGEWSMVPDFSNTQVNGLINRAKEELKFLDATVNARVIIAPAHRQQDCIIVGDIAMHTPRTLKPNAVNGECPALSDFIATANDHVGLFATTVVSNFDGLDDYTSLMCQILCHRLAEAATQWLHSKVKTELWGVPEDCGIRPAVGYPSLPDHSLIFELDKLLHLGELGITLTESGGMYPDASTCGIIISHPKSKYFS
ncbi:MAG: methionine synthase [Bacteroides sp.]|nr:methionine synthase [Bacteroides sp.]MCM1379943.1 methionine synthase [Bacteroides sp.]MCM1446202.1 methionine synthase [Prevotella sp.]